MKKKPFKLTKENVTRMLATAGISPAYRESYSGYDIYIGDGFVRHPDFTLRRFMVDKGEFPDGCYATFWFVAEDEKFVIGQMLPFDLRHDIHYDENSKRTARVAAAMIQARKSVDARKQAKRMRLH